MSNDVVAQLSVQVDANTVRLRTEMDKAAASTRAAARTMRAEVQEARGTIMVLGEEIGIHLPRHVQKFVASIPGIAPALSAAFSTVAVVAIGAAAVEAGKKLYEFYEKSKHASEEAAKATKDFIGGMHASNLEHEVQLAKLDEEIAKLEHRPANHLATALAEARAEAFKLGEQLRKDVDEAHKLIEEKLGAGWFQRAILGAAGSGGTLDQLDDYQAALEHAAKTVDPVERANKLNSLTGQKLDDLHEEIAARTRLQALEKKISDTQSGEPFSRGELSEILALRRRFNNGSPDATDQTRALNSLKAFHDMVQDQNQMAVDDLREIQGQGRLARDKGEVDALAEAKRRAQLRMQQLEDELAQQKNLHAMSAAEERDFWKSKMFAGLNLGDPVNALIQRRMAPLSQTAYREQAEELKNWAAMMADLNKESGKQFNENNPFGDKAQDRSRGADQLAGIEALHNRAELLREIAGAQQELNAKEAVESGLMRRGEEAIVAQRNALSKLQDELGELEAKRAAALLMAPEARGAKDNPEALQNEILQKQAGVDLAAQTLAYEQRQQTFAGQMRTMLDDWIERATDLSSIMKQFFESTLGTVNDALLKMGTQRDHRGVWGQAGKSIFTNVAKTGLQYAEGSLMKLLIGDHGKPDGSGGKPFHVILDSDKSGGSSGGVGGVLGGVLGKLGIHLPGLGGAGGGPLGTQGNPFYVKDVDGGGSGSGFSSMFGGGSGSDSGSGGFGQMFAQMLGFGGGMADGGVMRPGGFYLTGERGPELINVGSPSRIHNARETAGIMGSGGGDAGDTHLHFHTDARGSNDPVAVEAAVERSMRRWAPQIVQASHASRLDRQSRVANSKRGFV